MTKSRETFTIITVARRVSSSVERSLPKPQRRVRFPYPAPKNKHHPYGWCLFFGVRVPNRTHGFAPMKFSQNFIGTEAVQPPEYSRTPTSFRLRSERNSPTRRSAQEGRHQGFHPLVNHPFPIIVWRRPETGDRCENGERQSGYSCVYFATYSQFTDNVLLHRRLNQRRHDIPVSRNSLSWWTPSQILCKPL